MSNINTQNTQKIQENMEFPKTNVKVFDRNKITVKAESGRKYQMEIIRGHNSINMDTVVSIFNESKPESFEYMLETLLKKLTNHKFNVLINYKSNEIFIKSDSGEIIEKWIYNKENKEWKQTADKTMRVSNSTLVATLIRTPAPPLTPRSSPFRPIPSPPRSSPQSCSTPPFSPPPSHSPAPSNFKPTPPPRTPPPRSHLTPSSTASVAASTSASLTKEEIKKLVNEINDFDAEQQAIGKRLDRGEKVEKTEIVQLQNKYKKIFPLFSKLPKDETRLIETRHRTVISRFKKADIAAFGSEWLSILDTLNNPLNNQGDQQEEYNDKRLLLNDFLHMTYSEAMSSTLSFEERERQIQILEKVFDFILMPENANLKQAIESFTDKNYTFQRNKEIQNINPSTLESIRSRQPRINRLRVYDNYNCVTQ